MIVICYVIKLLFWIKSAPVRDLEEIMNNAKYFKELDFARFDFYFRSGLSDYIEARKKIYVVQHAAMIRYRR